MRLILYSLLLLTALGCRDKKTLFLTGGNEKYWDVMAIDRKKSPMQFPIPGYCYKFEANGKCHYYSYYIKGRDTLRKLFDFEDVIMTDDWKFQGDSILNVLGEDNGYKFIGEDTLVLYGMKEVKDTLLLVASQRK